MSDDRGVVWVGGIRETLETEGFRERLEMQDCQEVQASLVSLGSQAKKAQRGTKERLEITDLK